MDKYVIFFFKADYHVENYYIVFFFGRETLVTAVQNHVRSLNWGHRIQLHDK